MEDDARVVAVESSNSLHSIHQFDLRPELQLLQQSGKHFYLLAKYRKQIHKIFC